ncbi:hypothetical protein GPY51_10870 [Photorhabdus laumondii subsp. laumondii]|uniref:Photorhabdus luminescens subsp. laumondii TTO1 complete genome segment 10/17 n=2 Tax=Photorhabdus laumondii subsp. laumondii TaxID=141679 RepID=Q7N2Y9_PHOLL|nr:hypothetical protein [Photorhabdus laumondii]AWK42642.1 hypothetical protein A4R40_14645 [Photorhabdus laumondii subsp. laumondii]AXG47966.1 hypothetical protein PluTT01m_15065 [Photorhabdus laumondii subsp. laumondii]MCC8384623.1 hypothetical protein [Photorhabdus laumondii]MCC8413331.1 hypothetical protein [Photorhabdus laumondii]NDK94997.1 hypothetical protein [Photorhabdus laumondii subsp. laumondii]
MNPYAVYDEIEEKRLEDEHYREIILEQQGMDAEIIYNKLPELAGIFSIETNKLFGELLTENDEAAELVNSLLYELSLMKVKMEDI